MAQVVSGQRRSVHRAYVADRGAVTVSCQAVYAKLNGLAPDLSARLVRHTADRAAAVLAHLHDGTPLLANPAAAGLEVRIVDGNHFAGTEHRLAEARTTRAAPLPAQALVVLDPRRRLMVDMVPCENAHAQERALVPRLLELVHADELWLADRNFCTTVMLFGIARRLAYFLIRQHASTLHVVAEGPVRPCGRIAAGTVSEQAVTIEDRATGERMEVRRITLALDVPTRDGATTIVLLTNVPADVAGALELAGLYKDRWQVEAAFGEMAKALACEVRTLGYPRAAIFAFALGLATYNAFALVRGGLAAAHGEAVVRDEVSFHHLALDLAEGAPGMLAVVGPKEWGAFARMDGREFADVMRALMAGADLGRCAKSTRGERKPRPPRTSGKRNHHVATWKLLATRQPTAAGSSAGP